MNELLKTYQQKIALCIGFVAVAAIGFYGGRSINSKSSQDAQLPVVSASSNYSPNQANVQTTANTSNQNQSGAILDCTCKIKGSSSHKYHLPGGAFYNKTTHPIACFDTEADARAAGFTKSSR